jgi:hypothetical protein
MPTLIVPLAAWVGMESAIATAAAAAAALFKNVRLAFIGLSLE